MRITVPRRQPRLSAKCEIFEKLAIEFPDIGSQQFAFACLLATCPAPEFRNADRAVATAQRAVQLSPLSQKYWRVLGIAQYRSGTWQAAVDALGKAVELSHGEDNVSRLFLAMAHWQLGDMEQARKSYDQAAKWMDEHRHCDPELRRFRAEAEELLKITDEKPTTKPELK